MKIGILILISISIAQQLCAQTPEIERLINKSKKATGKEKIIALAEVSKNFCTINPKKGIEYGQKALLIAESQNLPSVKSKVYNSIGSNYWALADYKTARAYFEKAFQNAIKYKDSLEIAKSYNRMGLIYEAMGSYDSSLIVFTKELIINKRLGSKEQIGKSLENIGTINLHRGQLKSAITYFLEAKIIYEESKNQAALPYIYLKLGAIYSESKDNYEAEKWFKKGIKESLAINDFQKAGIGLNSIGILYKNQNKYDEALEKYNEALKMIGNLDNNVLRMKIYGNIGNVYTKQKKYQKAIEYHQKSLDFALAMNMSDNVAISYINIGENYKFQKDYIHARTYYENALPIFEANKTQENLLKTYEALIEVNNSLKDFEQSAKYYELYISVKDSLNKNELNTALDSLKIKFKTEQTNKENIFLTQKAEIQNKTISLQRIIMFSSFIFLVLLISLIIVVIRSRQKTKKANDLLGIKNLDISAKAEELRIINDKLVELSEFKDLMNSFLIHDLKNPLNTIINIDDKQNPEQQIAAIQQSGKQMLNLVLNLLDFSKYENKAMNLSFKDTSVTQIIKSAYSDVQYLADQKSISFKSNIPSDFIVKVDPEIIERVFVNLFSNAIKFSSTGEGIQVSAEFINQNSLKIIVKDNGDGIDAEYLPIIFDKFAQVHTKHSGSVRSTGIGLTFCKMAIVAHQGEIGVDSIIGQGSSFWFTVPLAGSQSDLIINPSASIESYDKSIKLQFSDEEINLLIPHFDRLKKLSIYQISDVKDILNFIDFQESANIKVWKSALLKALSDCNELEYNKLINLTSNDKL